MSHTFIYDLLWPYIKIHDRPIVFHSTQLVSNSTPSHIPIIPSVPRRIRNNIYKFYAEEGNQYNIIADFLNIITRLSITWCLRRFPDTCPILSRPSSRTTIVKWRLRTRLNVVLMALPAVHYDACHTMKSREMPAK